MTRTPRAAHLVSDSLQDSGGDAGGQVSRADSYAGVRPDQVIAGVDTHSRTHHAAVIDHLGRQLGDREFPATAAGYRDLLAWITTYGNVAAIGVEGTGAFGAELARIAVAAGIVVVDVCQPSGPGPPPPEGEV